MESVWSQLKGRRLAGVMPLFSFLRALDFPYVQVIPEISKSSLRNGVLRSEVDVHLPVGQPQVDRLEPIGLARVFAR